MRTEEGPLTEAQRQHTHTEEAPLTVVLTLATQEGYKNHKVWNKATKGKLMDRTIQQATDNKCIRPNKYLRGRVLCIKADKSLINKVPGKRQGSHQGGRRR